MYNAAEDHEAFPRPRVCVLGSLRVDVDGAAVAVASAKQRLLVQRLAVDAGRSVSRGEIIDALWGDNPPASVGKNLQVLVGRVRRLLEPEATDDGRWQMLQTAPDSYRLDPDACALDSVQFERGAARALARYRRGETSGVRREFDALLSMWRGPAFADVGDAGWVVPARRRLEEQRRAAACATVELALLEHDAPAVLDRAAELVESHRFDERVRALHVAALHEAGRIEDARAAHARTCELLAEEVGVDAGPLLETLGVRLANGDSVLDVVMDVPGPGVHRPAGDPRPVMLDGADGVLALLDDGWVDVDELLDRGRERGLDPIDVLDVLEQLVTASRVRRRRDDSGSVLLRRTETTGEAG